MHASPDVIGQPLSDSIHHAVAPAWHTVMVLAILLGVSLAGAVNHSLSPLGGHLGRLPGYALVMLFEWLIVAFIWFGVSRRDIRMADLIGGKWPRAVDFFRDLGIAVGFLIVSGLVLNGLSHLFKATPNQAIRNLLPETPAEKIVFLLLAVTAGFCEELIFRGYLQRQFAAWTRASAGGIILQGITFGLGHGYQGWKYMAIIAVFGTLFGLLVYWRRSLLPGMLAHFLQDGVGGLLARRLGG